MRFEKGSVLHVENFPGDHRVCKKFVYVLGHASPFSVLVFTITSQGRHAAIPKLATEMVPLRAGILPCLPSNSWIHCFYHAAESQIGSLPMTRRGQLSDGIFSQVRKVVAQSGLLSARNVAEYLDVMDNDRSASPEEEDV